MRLARTTRRGLLRGVLALAATPIACQMPPSAEVCANDPERLALDPVYVALALQETIRLDDRLVATAANVLERARTVEPHLVRIHALPPWSPDRLYIWAQRPEISEAWANREVTTGVEELDFLLREYLADAVEPSGDRPDEFVLHFAEPLNAARLLERLSEIDGVSGSVLWVLGDSDRIDVEPTDGGWRVTFTLGWGDCQAGCIYRHSWGVLVPAGEGAPVLVRDWGESAEWFMDCVPVGPDGSPG